MRLWRPDTIVLIRLLSINIWDLPVPLPGFARSRRRRDLLAHLPLTDADLVLIQEAFLPAFKVQLASALSDHQPDRYLERRRRHLLFPMDGSGGLATFSRLDLVSSTYLPFRSWRGMKPDERVGRKGCLWSEVATTAGNVLVGNVHLYAGVGPDHARARAMQTRHLLRQLEQFPRMPTVIAGDFNMAIEYERAGAGPTGFDLMRDAGFSEIAAGTTGTLATMSPLRNPFARYLPGTRPERRLTQVFYRGDGLRLAEPPQLCLCEPPVSDHFGLLTTISLG
jgi:endonuclease/exonuclease/phosphatase family metal-dependent hydrolase